MPSRFRVRITSEPWATSGLPLLRRNTLPVFVEYVGGRLVRYPSTIGNSDECELPKLVFEGVVVTTCDVKASEVMKLLGAAQGWAYALESCTSTLTAVQNEKKIGALKYGPWSEVGTY